MGIHANPWKSIKILGNQEASLESRKGFDRGSRSLHRVLEHYEPRVKILRGQEEAILESSKGFYEGQQVAS